MSTASAAAAAADATGAGDGVRDAVSDETALIVDSIETMVERFGHLCRGLDGAVRVEHELLRYTLVELLVAIGRAI